MRDERGLTEQVQTAADGLAAAGLLRGDTGFTTTHGDDPIVTTGHAATDHAGGDGT